MGTSTKLKELPGSWGLLPVLGAALLLIICSGAARAAQTYENSPGERKVLSRVDPDYPVALKRLYIGGVVWVDVVVAPGGSVTRLKLLGGSPILGQSTMNAIKTWNDAPALAPATHTVKIE